MKTRLFAVLVISSIVLAACSNDDPAAKTNVAVEMKAVSTEHSMSSGRVASNTIVFNEVLVGVTELEFETLDEDQAEEANNEQDGENNDGEHENEEIEFEGEYIVDLIHGTSTPDFGVASVLPGKYEEIEISMGPILPDGKTLFVSFTYQADGGAPVTVEYTNNHELELELKKDGGYDLTGSDLTQLLVVLDLDALFSGLDLSTATVDGDGVIRINETSNSELAALINSNFKNACDAGEDNNDDGEIDEDNDDGN